MKNIKFQNQLITILITFILILGCEGEMEEGDVEISEKAAKNLCPIGKPDEYTVQNGKSLEIDFNKGVLSNDEDPGGGAMSATIVVGPQAGTVTLTKTDHLLISTMDQALVKIILFMSLQTQLVTIPKNLKYLVWLQLL